MNKNIILAKIIEPHGIKGLVKILPFGEDISLLESLSPLTASNGKNITVILKNPIGRYMIAAIAGINTREDAEKLKGVELGTSADNLPAITDKDTFYPHQLIGLSCIGEDGTPLGHVIDVPDYGAGPLLEIRPEDGNAPFLLPFTNEFVPDVNLAAGTVTIIPQDMI
jgi:16S rRNA processing protein RimM